MFTMLPSNTLQTNQASQLNAISSGASLHATAALVNARTTVDNPFYCNQSSEVPEPTENKRSLSSTVASLLKIQAAPNVTIDTFNGDCLEFKYFMTTFEDVIESNIDNARGRLTRLIQYTSGEAKDLAKGCVYLNPEDGYKKAKELLQKRFGDPLRVLAAYQRELREWKPIKSLDTASLQRLYTFLVKTSNIATEHFNSYQILCTITSKLPANLRDRWNRSVY